MKGWYLSGRKSPDFLLLEKGENNQKWVVC